MSNLMRDAVIAMPLDIAMADEMSCFQFHNRAQELLVQVQKIERERDALYEALKDLLNSNEACDRVPDEWLNKARVALALVGEQT